MCSKFKLWTYFHKKKNGKYGYESKCIICRKKERKKKTVKKQLKTLRLDDLKLSICTKLTGDLTKSTINNTAMILCESYKYRKSS